MTSIYAVVTSHSNRDISMEISKLETSLAEVKLWGDYFTFQLISPNFHYKWCFIILREDCGGGGGGGYPCIIPIEFSEI